MADAAEASREGERPYLWSAELTLPPAAAGAAPRPRAGAGKQGPGPRGLISPYYDRARIARLVAQGRHREAVGGRWEEMGRLQLELAREHGLRPESRVLDIGCGCFRAGVRLLPELEPGRYYGVEMHAPLLQAGLQRELRPLGLAERLGEGRLLCTDRFEFQVFGVQFDLALAIALFRFLPFNHLRMCLEKLARVVRPGGRLLATYLECPPEEQFSAALEHEGGLRSFPARAPYHYLAADLRFAAYRLPWRIEDLGPWGPEGERLVSFLRLLEVPQPGAQG
ncbi:MAG: class I SAM-dependent methyltransferase [Gammaproteobacteria bacterium]|nr:MAG: class I SAM-dependent methyltransferase [Gammaproteobacteria bacterium]